MSQVVMNELVNVSQEIIKLRDEKYELLAALKRFLVWSDSVYYGTDTTSELKGAKEHARQVIAKAEGDQQ